MKVLRKWLIVGLLLLLAVPSCNGPNSALTPAPTIQGVPIPSAQNAADTITSSGIVIPSKQVRLSFQVSGQVEQLTMGIGDIVQAGQLLARLDTDELERAKAQAEADLAIAQAQLAQSQSEAGEETIASAQSGIAAAKAGLADAQAQLAAAQARQSEVERQLADAQSAYQKALDRPWEPQEVRDAMERELIRAQENLDVAEADYRAAQMRVPAAQAQVDEAIAQLNTVMAGATPEEVAAARARVVQAQLTLEQAEVNLAQANLTAPFAGTVAAVMIREGEATTAGMPVIELIDTSRWRIETDAVGELQINRVKIGQSAIVNINAFVNEELTGTVIAIFPIPIVQRGDTTYTVTLELEETNLELKWGMTARVMILTGG